MDVEDGDFMITKYGPKLLVILYSESFFVSTNSKPLPEPNSSPEQDSNPEPKGPKHEPPPLCYWSCKNNVKQIKALFEKSGTVRNS
jgi:hypothetical protein